MKKLFTVSAFLLTAVLVSSCFSPLQDENGSLTIVWGNSRMSRSFVQEDDLAELAYNITLTGPGGTIEREFPDKSLTTSATFTVVPGTWTVTVKGYKYYIEDDYYKLRLMGIEQVQVTAGTNGPKVINMYTATEAASWSELRDAVLSENDDFYFTELQKNPLNPREEIILIKNSVLSIVAGEPIHIRRPITLITESPVRIVRPVRSVSQNEYNYGDDDYGDGYNDDDDDYLPFFYVISGGSLTLGKNGMTGTLTFYNQNEGSRSHFMISSEDEEGGSLVMNNGVTIQGSSSFEGAGVFVTGGSAFTMNGGTITGNRVGVYAGDMEKSDFRGAAFIMNGGTIARNAIGVFVGGSSEPEFPGAAFTMNGGTITGNGSLLHMEGIIPAGVYVEWGGKFYHEGGVISNNTPEDVYEEPEGEPGKPPEGEGPGTDEPGTDGPGTDGPGTDGPGTDGPGTEEPPPEPKVISALYLNPDGTLVGTIYSGSVAPPTVITKEIELTESSIGYKDGTLIINNVYSGEDHGFTPSNGGTGKWAYLYQDGTKIGIIFVDYPQGNKSTYYFLGVNADDNFIKMTNNYGINLSVDSDTSAFDTRYSGSGWTERQPEPQVIADCYLEYDGTLMGRINSAPDTDLLPITLTENSISSPRITINNVYSGENHGFTPSNGGTGKWAYLYKDGTKIGIIFVTDFQGYKSTSYYLGSDARQNFPAGRDNNYGIILSDDLDESDFDTAYSGSGWTT